MHRRLQVVWWLQWIFRSFFCPNMLANIVSQRCCCCCCWLLLLLRVDGGSKLLWQPISDQH